MFCGILRLRIILLLIGVGWIGACHAWGTLVLVIPTSEGVVLAADSRITLRKRYVDGVSKIRLVPQRVDMAFALTGQSEFLPAVPDDATAEELRYAWERGPWQYSGQTVVQQFLASRPNASLDEKLLSALGKRLCDTLVDALRGRVNGRPFFGKRLFRVAVVQYDRSTTTGRIGSVRLDLSPAGIPTVGDVKLDVVNADNPKTVFIFGERGYFEDNVLRGVGSRYIADEVTQIWGTPASVRDFSIESAAIVARGWIGATARTAELVPMASGVGGPLKLFLVNGIQAARGLGESEGK